MHRISVSTQSRYPVAIKKIKSHLEECLNELKVTYPVEISVLIAGDRKVHALNKKYRNKDKTTNVLSFPAAENKEGLKFPTATPGYKFLGDIVISFPQVLKEAARENKLIERKVSELLEHGLLHLLGFHHPEH